MRKLMDVEIKALEDLTSGDEASFDGIVSREAAAESPIQPVLARKTGVGRSRKITCFCGLGAFCIGGWAASRRGIGQTSQLPSLTD
jgi:hypothetical protein